MRNKLTWIHGLFAVAWLANFPAWAALPIEQWRTATGTRVLFVETHDLPMLDLAVDFPAGSSRDASERSGLAALTLGLMRMGTTASNEEDLSARLADVGAQLSSRFDTDRAGYSLRSLSSAPELARALSVFNEVLHSPVFPAEILDREKQRLVSGLREADSKPETIAEREFKRLIYGDHPYALRERGEVETVTRLARQDLLDFHARYYDAGQAVISIIGDASREQARTMAERISGGLRRAGAALPLLARVVPPARAELRRVAHPASQAHIAIGQPGIKRLDPDYFPLWLGNYVLGGGGFSSRLNEEIRQKRGFAYSAYSYFSPLLLEGPFQIGLQTRGDQAEEALKVARDTLARFVADGPTEEELDAAKQNVVGGFALRIDSNRKILEYLSLIGFYRLPLTYLEDFPVAIEKVTLAQVRDAFQRRIHPDRMTTVIVGGGQSP